MEFDKDFMEWIEKSDMCADNQVLYSYMNYGYDNHDTFKALPFSMQWGVYIDFFDEKSIRISIAGNYNYMINSKHVGEFYKSRKEARKAALTKAIEIYNGSK